MIALRNKNVVEDRNILYLECDCGCNILIMEKWKDGDFSIWSHDQTAIKTATDSSYLCFRPEEAKRLMEAILSLKDAKNEPKDFIFEVELDSNGDSVYLVVDNHTTIFHDDDDPEHKHPIITADEDVSISCFISLTSAKDALAGVECNENENANMLWGIVVMEESAKILYEYATGILEGYREANNKV